MRWNSKIIVNSNDSYFFFYYSMIMYMGYNNNMCLIGAMWGALFLRLFEQREIMLGNDRFEFFVHRVQQQVKDSKSIWTSFFKSNIIIIHFKKYQESIRKLIFYV